MKNVFCLLLTCLISVFLIAGSASAESILVDDDDTGGNSYGNTTGFAIDFDATAPAASEDVTTGWDPALVDGKTYPLDTVSMQYGGSVTSGTGVVYLGVYSTGLGEGFLGASTNAIDFNAATADEWYTWEFDGIDVTVDSVVGEGTGLLYFRYQPSQTSGDISGEISTRRLNYDADMTEAFASIIAYGTLQAARAPEYQAHIGGFGPGEAAYDPLVTPDNGDGSVGTLQPNNEDVEVSFEFKAGADLSLQYDPPYPVNPDILGHYIYLSNGSETDPNAYLLDYVEHVHNDDPNLTDPSVSYGPVQLVDAQGKTFLWQVEEAIDDGAGNPYTSGDPNNILGPVWSFSAVGATPSIITGPDHTIADENGDVSFIVTTGSIANNFRWAKVVGEQDTDENGETDDIILSDGGIYSDTQTKTLVITGGTTGNGAEGQYYCIAYNGDPEGVYLATVSQTAWFWVPRLVSHYTFESMSVVDGNDVTPDIVSGFDMTMLSNDTGLDVPALEPNVVAGLSGSTFSLKFDNPAAADPNSVDAQYAHVSEPWAGGYKDLTISAWVYSAGGANWNRILDFGDSNENYMFLCLNPGSVNGAVRFAVTVDGTEQSVSSPDGVLPDHEWTYITATLSGDTGRIYVDGELVGTNTNLVNDPVSYGPASQNWLARSQWGGGDGYFNGNIDELKIYNYARTTDEVAQDYLGVRGEWVCNFELVDLPYDFDDNCHVDLADFAIFAATWLDSYRIYLD